MLSVFIGVVMVVVADYLPHLVRREVGDDLLGRTERIGYVGYAVGVHHALHNLAIDRHRYKYLHTPHHRRPMLVADGVAQLDGGG